jgi:hypothetical protein
MTGIELLDYIYIAGWVLRVLAVGGLFLNAVLLVKIARKEKN